MDKRQFSYVAGELDAGYYVNFVFHADPQLITKLRSKFKLDPEVYRQNYQRLRPKGTNGPRKSWRKRSNSVTSGGMASFNKVILLGNLTRDPEVRYTPKGTAVTEFGMAVNRVYTAENGEKREEATFVDVTLWGRTAEIAGEYLKKGRPVFIEGRLQLDTWDDKQSGQKRSKLKVVGEGLQLIGSRPAAAVAAETTEGSSAPAFQPSPPLRRKQPPSRPTTTRFHFRLRSEPADERFAVFEINHDPHRSLYRAEHASDDGPGAVAKAPGGLRNARARSRRAP